MARWTRYPGRRRHLRDTTVRNRRGEIPRTWTWVRTEELISRDSSARDWVRQNWESATETSRQRCRATQGQPQYFPGTNQRTSVTHCNLGNASEVRPTRQSPSLIRGGLMRWMAKVRHLDTQHVSLDRRKSRNICPYMSRDRHGVNTGGAWAAASWTGARSRPEEFLAWNPTLDAVPFLWPRFSLPATAA